MALDLAQYQAKLKARRAELLAEDELSEADRAPVTLDQESVGRLSRIDAMQMQAMAMAQLRRRQGYRLRNSVEHDEVVADTVPLGEWQRRHRGSMQQAAQRVELAAAMKR